ncbi:hypothetical protein [Streptomyces sp. 4R-3d]|uniref:hypothetical protein n=1 Tax=Streptomyces sp. 4R-3d TaxID=2559605 RepID=UPI001072D8B2|nr:hypothetical protein [Streptomyces sp. 4R-3d]TFI25543.1 hypothetical protein E4P36_19065 [Streptomyces sp. 4R-3d]
MKKDRLAVGVGSPQEKRAIVPEKNPSSGVRNETAIDAKDNANVAKQQKEKQNLIEKMKAKNQKK